MQSSLPDAALNARLDRRRLLGLGVCGAAAVALAPLDTGAAAAVPAAVETVNRLLSDLLARDAGPLPTRGV